MISYKLNGTDFRYDRYTASVDGGVLSVKQSGKDNEVHIVSENSTPGTYNIEGQSSIFLDCKAVEPKTSLFVNENVNHSGYIKIISHEDNVIVGEFEVFFMKPTASINKGRFQIEY